MRNVIVAFGSFVFGVLAASLLGFGNAHTSTVLQPAFAAQTTLVNVEGAAPVVPTLKLFPVTNGTVAGPGILKLDGIDCINCKVSDGATIQYWGGPYQFENLARSGVVGLDLKGAALNTEGLLASFGLILCLRQRRRRNREIPMLPR